MESGNCDIDKSSKPIINIDNTYSIRPIFYVCKYDPPNKDNSPIKKLSRKNVLDNGLYSLQLLRSTLPWALYYKHDTCKLSLKQLHGYFMANKWSLSHVL